MKEYLKIDKGKTIEVKENFQMYVSEDDELQICEDCGESVNRFIADENNWYRCIDCFIEYLNIYKEGEKRW